jgi:hypothetical protein
VFGVVLAEPSRTAIGREEDFDALDRSVNGHARHSNIFRPKYLHSSLAQMHLAV